MAQSKSKKVHAPTKIKKGAKNIKKDDNQGDNSSVRVSLAERVRREKEELEQKFGRIGDGAKREIARMTFALWLTIPARYRGAPDNIISTLGIEDEDILELIKVRTSQDFGEVFNVSHQALCEWRKEMTESDELDHRVFFKKLMNGAVAALHRKLIENGDAERFKVFAQYIENWMPGVNLRHSGSSDELSEQRRKELDEFIERNSRTVV